MPCGPDQQSLNHGISLRATRSSSKLINLDLYHCRCTSVRLKDFHVSHQENFGVLALQVQAAHGGDKLEFIFPSDNEKAVSQAMDQMLLSRDSAK